MAEGTLEVRLPAELCELVLASMGSRFSNIEELLTYVLQELLRGDALKMDQDEQRVIEARLKDLGYL